MGQFLLYLYRYAGQGCIIGQSNLSGQQVDSLLEESTDDSEILDTLRNTEVLLSLNKKRRWRLPATVCHMIRAGQFSNSSAMVSVLERHKLKRRANCVGFACSKKTGGVGLGFQSGCSESRFEGQKRYFSYSLDHVDQEESRRSVKKRIAEELKSLSKKKKGDKKKDAINTVDVFTVEGRRGNHVTNTSPVYNLEVFYPCPQSCSLTFNPKYTDVSMTQNDDGEMEIRSKVGSVKKSQRKHRKRFSPSDLANFNSEATSWDDDVQEMWREVYEDGEETSYSCHSLDVNGRQRHQSFSSSEEISSEDGDLDQTSYVSESILSRLVDQAELARAQWSNSYNKSCQKRRSRHHSEKLDRGKKTNPQWSDSDVKSHILTTERDIHGTLFPGQPESVTSQGSSNLKDGPVLCSVPVILSTNEVAPRNLKERFGNAYGEADCQPRRFCINITEEVRNVMSLTRSLISQMHTTFVIFTSARICQNGLETYHVMVNCAGCPESEHLTYAMPQGQTSLDSVLNTFVGNLFDLKKAGHVNFSDETPSCDTHALAPVNEMMLNKLKIQVDTFFTSDELSKASKTGSLQEKPVDANYFSASQMHLVNDSEIDIFCEICYENINATLLDTAHGTQLNACRHLFCDKCWRAHLRTRLREGTVHMTCPGYQCDTKLGPSTLLSLLHVTEVAQILQRACEDEVEICPTAKWCPITGCGRVLKLSTKLLETPGSERSSLADDTCLDVTCACGESWCFSCLSPAHWPARCGQAEDYLEKMKTLKPRDDNRDEETVFSPKPKPQEVEPLQLEGRLCPKCRRFINKNGGCPHMTCKCGHEFCWTCLRTYDSFHFDCRPDNKTVTKYSRVVRVRHLGRPDVDHGDGEQAARDEKETKSTKTASRRQKSSMYHRATQQRVEAERDNYRPSGIGELVSKICRATREDLQFKEEVSQGSNGVIIVMPLQRN